MLAPTNGEVESGNGNEDLIRLFPYEDDDDEQQPEQSSNHNQLTSVGETVKHLGSEDSATACNVEPEEFRKAFIGGLRLTTTEDELNDFYKQWGELVDCVVMKDSTTNRSRGFGFITYKTADALDTAMANRPHVIDGKTVDPKRAVPKENCTKSEAQFSCRRLYLSGITQEIEEEDIQKYFERFGCVTDVELAECRYTKNRRGFGYVTFDDYDPVDKCVIMKNHVISGVKLDVRKHFTKTELTRIAQQEKDRHERLARTRQVVLARVSEKVIKKTSFDDDSSDDDDDDEARRILKAYTKALTAAYPAGILPELTKTAMLHHQQQQIQAALEAQSGGYAVVNTAANSRNPVASSNSGYNYMDPYPYPNQSGSYNKGYAASGMNSSAYGYGGNGQL